MATKTISLKTEAYDRLVAARRYPSESFSEVVLRASWPEDTLSASAFLRHVRTAGRVLSDDVWMQVERLKASDDAPDDKWAVR